MHGYFVHACVHRSGKRIVEDDSQSALVLATELAHLERAGSSSRFPVDVPGGIFGHIFPDAIEIVAAPPDESLKLARHHGQNIEELLWGLHRGIDNDLAGQCDLAGFEQKSKRKTGGQSEILVAIASAGRKRHFQVSSQLLSGGEKGEIDRLLQN